MDLPPTTDERLRLALEAAGIGLWDFDAESGQHYWSPRGRLLLDLDPDAPVDFEALLQRVHPAERERVRAALDAAMVPCGNGQFDRDFRIVTGDGRTRWLRANGRAAFRDGVFARMTGTLVDITPQRDATERLRINDERLRTALAASPISLATQDRDLRYTWLHNPLTFQPEELLGRTDLEVMDAEDGEILTLIRADVLRSGVGRREIIRIRRGGHVVFCDLVVEPIRDEEDNITGLTTAAVDITDRVRSETALSAHADRLHALNRAALVINSTITLDELIQTATEQALLVGGAEAATTQLTVDGRTLEVRAGAATSTRERIRAALTTRENEHLGYIELAGKIESEFRGDDEALLVQLAQMLSVAIENRRLTERTQAAARARDEMVAIVSHDLRNPLTAIQTSIQLLELDAKLSADARQYLGFAKQAASRMRRLVADLLDVSKIEAGMLSIQRRPVDVAALLRDAATEFRDVAATRNITFTTYEPPTGATLNADPDRLLQVFSNLIGNALKFTPEGGSVKVEARLDAGHTRLCISDSGKGVAPEERDRIFDRYWQSGRNDRQEGAGLGLAIARGIIEAHGGTIHVEDAEPAPGAMFVISLPV
ncbi:MAG TPA: ATP-binding protein [Thermoanaerobaculia bacterium]